jgi:hypothetical protein
MPEFLEEASTEKPKSRYHLIIINMKNLLLIVGLFLVVSLSCKKSDDSPTYTQSMLNGTWEDILKDDKGCTDQLIISASGMSEKTICTSSTVTVDYQTYSFDGKKIKVSVLGINAEYVINELTDTKLVMTLNAAGSSLKSEYKKK